MSVVLASGSPRRRELLEMLGIKELKIIPPETEETLLPGRSPEKQAAMISAAKARDVAARCDIRDTVIAADTIVVTGGKIFGKPGNKEEAVYMLSELSGKSHTVYTGLTVINGGSEMTEIESTTVKFRDIGDREIEAYVESGEPADKAGAYGIQGKGALFVESINGDYCNVMGLPLCRLGLMLKKMGVNLI